MYLLAFTYRCMPWHILSLMSFSTISSMSTSVSNSNSTYFGHIHHANTGADKKYACSSLQSVYLLRNFERFCPRIDHDTLQGFLYWNLPRLFSCVCSQHLQYLLLSGCCKILSCMAMTFYWIFTNYLCTRMDKHLSATSNKICWGLYHIVCALLEIYWLDLCQTFFIIFAAVYTLEFGCHILKTRLKIFASVFVGSFRNIIS